MSKMDLSTLVAIVAAFDSGTGNIVALPEADCEHCEYDKLPHDGGHCYMFADAPESGLCGAFEPTRYKMDWKT